MTFRCLLETQCPYAQGYSIERLGLNVLTTSLCYLQRHVTTGVLRTLDYKEKSEESLEQLVKEGFRRRKPDCLERENSRMQMHILIQDILI